MNSVTFAEFYGACRDRLTDEQLRNLNPKAEYFEIEGSYFGLLIEEDRTWISIAVGGVNGCLGLKQILKQSDAGLVGWVCRDKSPSMSWARYYKASITDSGEKYADGAIVWRCIINTLQTQRIQKVASKVKALI